MTENRSGMVVTAQVTTAYGSAECHAGLLMAEQLPGCGRVTLGADKGYDQREFVEELRCMGVTPHVAQNQGREIKINTRPGQTRESATKRAEPCSIEIFQHPARSMPTNCRITTESYSASSTAGSDRLNHCCKK